MQIIEIEHRLSGAGVFLYVDALDLGRSAHGADRNHDLCRLAGKVRVNNGLTAPASVGRLVERVMEYALVNSTVRQRRVRHQRQVDCGTDVRIRGSACQHLQMNEDRLRAARCTVPGTDANRSGVLAAC